MYAYILETWSQGQALNCLIRVYLSSSDAICATLSPSGSLGDKEDGCDHEARSNGCNGVQLSY